ncbi:MAG: hypothetical protein KF878_33890 [Planctomycetes bacterium]|nr:hypothetical protein [Planctomycetota bacterium]MCW8140590.1 hypothetical protein [Planctomycetota bacterium]
MSDASFYEDMERITSRMNQVSLAKSLVKKGAYREALQILRGVREKYTEESMVKMVDFLIRDLESKMAPGSPPTA